MPHSVTRIAAKNFRSLQDVDVPLRPFSVLIGPNGAGKTNLLNVLRFLATTVRFDLSAALDDWRGFEGVQRQGEKTGRVELTIEGLITSNSSYNAPDSYTLRLTRRGRSISRTEEFTFKRYGGQGRRISVRGSQVTIEDDGREAASRDLAGTQTTGLATLPKLSDTEGGLGIRSFSNFLQNVRVLEPDIASARLPARRWDAPLAEDASNLADALQRIRRLDPDAWNLLVSDVRKCLPGLQDIRLQPVGGAARAVVVELIESGVSRPTDLIDASFGTVRILALLAALHEPEPPAFTAIEEVDHGLHPYALDLLVDRLRSASRRTQILCATHSPTFVNRLRPEEIIVCDRDPETGASIIPSMSQQDLRKALSSPDWQAGELWFMGALGGVPE